MDQTDITPLIDDLASNIDDLEEALAPLLDTPLRDTASKLPLLDKAKLHVLTTYSIESILFSYLNLSSVAAKEHPVYEELSRVKQYFGKIKSAENGPLQRPSNRTLDKSAAGRFIKHGLAGNEKYDQQRSQRQIKERQNAKIKFDELSEHMEQERIVKEQKAGQLKDKHEEDDSDDSDSSSASSSSDDELEVDDGALATPEPSRRKRRPVAADLMDVDQPSKRGKKRQSDTESTESRTTKTRRKQKSNQAPRGQKEAFKALLNGPIPEHRPKKKMHKKPKT